MGFLDRLFGSRPELTDRVFRTEAQKLDDLIAEARRQLREREPLVVVYHFRDMGKVLEGRFTESGIPFEIVRNPTERIARDLPASAGPGRLPLLPSMELPPLVERAASERPSGPPATVHLAEHYPIPGRDDQVLALSKVLPRESRFVGYVGLDEPWVRPFIGDSVIELLDRLGADEDECISHAMVGRALRNAQEKLASRAQSFEQPADSCADWLLVNLKPGS